MHEESINTIYSDHNTVMLGLDKLTYNRSTKDGRFVNVDTNTLDKIIHSTGIKEENIKWIKIDVEEVKYEVIKRAINILSKSKDITILIEVHHLDENKNLYKDIMDLLKVYKFKIEFEKIYYNGERHIIIRKQQL